MGYNIDKEQKQWEKEKKILDHKLKIEKEKRKYKKKISTSKLLIFFLFLNCTLIELFTGYITIKSFALAEIIGYAPDFTPLVTLIGAVVGEVIGFAVYSIKAKAENTQGGIDFEREMFNLRQGDTEYKE